MGISLEKKQRNSIKLKMVLKPYPQFWTFPTRWLWSPHCWVVLHICLLHLQNYISTLRHRQGHFRNLTQNCSAHKHDQATVYSNFKNMTAHTELNNTFWSDSTCNHHLSCLFFKVCFQVFQQYPSPQATRDLQEAFKSLSLSYFIS